MCHLSFARTIDGPEFLNKNLSAEALKTLNTSDHSITSTVFRFVDRDEATSFFKMNSPSGSSNLYEEFDPGSE